MNHSLAVKESGKHQIVSQMKCYRMKSTSIMTKTSCVESNSIRLRNQKARMTNFHIDFEDSTYEFIKR